MKKGLLFCFCLYVLAACNPTSEPLIEGDIVKLKIECTNGEMIEIDDQKTINKVIREINSSRRESSEEMEFDFEHRAILEDSDGEKENEFFNLFTGGKAVVSGYYIHSNINDFCEK